MKGSWHLGTVCDGASDLAANQTVAKSTTIVCIRTHHSSQYKGLQKSHLPSRTSFSHKCISSKTL